MPSRSASRVALGTRVGELERRAVRLRRRTRTRQGAAARRARRRGLRSGDGARAGASTVSLSSAMRRRWWVFSSASSQRPPVPLRIAWRSQIDSRPSSRLTADQRMRADLAAAGAGCHRDPQLRAPVRDRAHASVRIRAASSGVGGSGFSFGAAGGSAWLIGLNATHRQRTAFL